MAPAAPTLSRAALAPSLLLLLLLLAAGRAEAGVGRVCELGGYCSVGQVAGYVGPVDSAAQLRQALQATAFKQELIVVPENRVFEAAQVLTNFRDAGYAHMLVIMDAQGCARLQGALRPRIAKDGPISCGSYDSKELESPVGFSYFKRGVGMVPWWWKWMTTGRAVALGYNVLAIDADVVAVGDWYWRAKQPPLSSMHMMCQNEAGNALNAGFCYFQNAASNGPVVWVLYELLQRAVRWAEDSSVLEATSPWYRSHNEIRVDDQGTLQNTLFSAVLGRPVFLGLVVHYNEDNEAYKSLGASNRNDFARDIYTQVDPLFKPQVFTPGPELAAVACETYAVGCSSPLTAIRATVATLRIPHSGGQWPPSLGGYPFNRSIGPYTAMYRKAYTDLGVPLPPDIEDPSTERAAKRVKEERFTFLAKGLQGPPEAFQQEGAWAQGGWLHVGRHGWWHTHLLAAGSSKTAMGHIWAGIFPGDFQKLVIMQLNGHFDWTSAARVAKGHNRYYLTYTENPQHILPHDAPDVRSVVAFSPGVIHSAMTKEQFVQAAQGLAQVAVALGAAVAWPAVPCDSEWALSAEGRKRAERPIRHSIPWWYLDTRYQVQPFGDSLEQLQCEWVGFTHRDCIVNRYPPGQDVGRGLLAVEFHHLRTTTGASPSRETTLLLPDESPPPPAGNVVQHHVSYDALLRANAEGVLRRLQRSRTTSVLWLDRLVAVDGMAGEAAATYGRWYDKCQALKYYSIPANQQGMW